MKHEPQKFGSAETFFFVIYAKLFLYTISDSESQTPLLQFFWRGGGGGGGVCTQASQAGQARSDGFALTLPPSPPPLK